MKKFKLAAITFSLVALSWPAASNNVIREAYLKNYVEQVTPTLKEMVVKYEPNLTDSESTAAIKVQATKMAGCQYQVAAQYPSKYSAASIEPVAQGHDLRQVTQNVNQLMQSDMQQGSISLEDFKTLVETGVALFKRCMAK